MIIRCIEHGPEVVGKGTANPTLAYNSKKYKTAIIPTNDLGIDENEIPIPTGRFDCSEHGCEEDGYAWVTPDEYEKYENGQRDFRSQDGRIIHLSTRTVYLGRYLGTDPDAAAHGIWQSEFYNDP